MNSHHGQALICGRECNHPAGWTVFVIAILRIKEQARIADGLRFLRNAATANYRPVCWTDGWTVGACSCLSSLKCPHHNVFHRCK
jgi:hypothetical protein